MTHILGINAYHGDSSACLVQDGKLVAAVEEERFRRVKHWAGFPSESIRYCLNEVGISLKDINLPMSHLEEPIESCGQDRGIGVEELL